MKCGTVIYRYYIYIFKIYSSQKQAYIIYHASVYPFRDFERYMYTKLFDVVPVFCNS